MKEKIQAAAEAAANRYASAKLSVRKGVHGAAQFVAGVMMAGTAVLAAGAMGYIAYHMLVLGLIHALWTLFIWFLLFCIFVVIPLMVLRMQLRQHPA